MPLGVRDFLLIIRAKDQASRVITDVGRSFGKLQKQSTASMREAANTLKAHTTSINESMRKDISGFQQTLRSNAVVSSRISSDNAKLRIQQANAITVAEKSLIGSQIRNNTLQKALIAEQNVAVRQALTTRRESAQEEVRIVQKSYNEQKAAFQRHNDDMQARMDRANKMRTQGQSLLGIGAGIGVAGAAGLAFLGSSTKDSIKYTQEAAKTFTQVPKELGASLDQIKNIGREVAKSIPAPFEQMQASLYDIFSSMSANVPQAELLLRNFAKGAVAGATDVETASQAAISLLNAYKLPPTAKNVKRVMDAQFETVRVGRIEYAELASTIGRAIPSAVKAGQSMEELGGLIAFLTRNGLSAAMSATSAARAFDLMTNPKFKENLGGLVAVADDKGNFRPFLEIMTDLRKVMNEGLGPEQATKMKNFMESVVDPKALEFLEEMGIKTKQVVGGKDFTGQLQRNAAASAKLTTANAQLRIKAAQSTSKAEKDQIAIAIKSNSAQKAILSEQNVNLRANGSKAKEALRPFGEIMKDIEEKMKSMSPEEAADFMAAITKGAGGTIQAMRAVNLAIFDTEDQFRTLTNDIRDNSGAAERAYKIMKETPQAKIEELKNKWKTMKTEIGDNMIPVLIKLLDWGIKILEWFDDLSPSTKKWIALGTFAAATFLAIAGAVTLAAGAFLVLSAALAPFGLTILGITLLFAAWLAVFALLGAAVYILIKHWEDFKAGIKVILASIVDVFLGFVDNILTALASAFGWIPGIGGKLRDARDEFRRFREGVNQDILGIKPLDLEVTIKPRLVTQEFYDAIASMAPVLGAAPDLTKFIPDTRATATLPTPPRTYGNIQARAMGGPVRAFGKYIVGERGPELLQMGAQPGNVMNNKDWRKLQPAVLGAKPRATQGMQFVKNAKLDTSQVTDLRGQNYIYPWKKNKPLLRMPWHEQRPYGPTESIYPSADERRNAQNGQGGNSVTVNARTDADAHEISHEVVFGMRYEV